MTTAAITETSKGHRVWLQGLTGKGITGERFTVEYGHNTILVTFGSEGKRKVTQAKGGIVDIVSKRVTQWAQGSTEARVTVLPNTQTIIIERSA